MSTEQDIIKEVIDKLKNDKKISEKQIDKLQRDLSSKVFREEDWALFLEMAIESEKEK